MTDRIELLEIDGRKYRNNDLDIFLKIYFDEITRRYQ
jgi:hypothetical protein